MALRPMVSSINHHATILQNILQIYLLPYQVKECRRSRILNIELKGPKKPYFGHAGDIFASFDVVSLFTNAPIDNTCKIKVTLYATIWHLNVQHAITGRGCRPLYKVVACIHLFQKQGKFYEQCEVQAMDSPRAVSNHIQHLYIMSSPK